MGLPALLAVPTDASSPSSPPVVQASRWATEVLRRQVPDKDRGSLPPDFAFPPDFVPLGLCFSGHPEAQPLCPKFDESSAGRDHWRCDVTNMEYAFGTLEAGAVTLCQFYRQVHAAKHQLLALVEVQEIIPGYFLRGGEPRRLGALVVSELIEALTARPELDATGRLYDAALAADQVPFMYPFVELDTPNGRRCTEKPVPLPDLAPGDRLLVSFDLIGDLEVGGHLTTRAFWWFRDGAIQPLPYTHVSDREPLSLEDLKGCLEDHQR